ncbi:hypothetical protein SAMN05880501_106213 [Ureibacillus xyleni]|uniref:Lipoprotein n=1 Tax=Ureibacillus xyleni TaxID=614648 RepID=A0A285SUF5_9BACL|nr:CueP family metal-binding protein [Ureibacillus xyleni]SOC11564.1 hypothetical protein SAMN05880501_106213 [Ureibacillus xyleni]
MKNKFVTITLFASVVLAACSGSSEEQNASQDIKTLVNDYSIGNLKAESASITSKELIVTNAEGKESTYALPEDEFFVSIAPYINETHPCENHSLTSCQGELVNETFDIYIEDSKGNVVVDETMKTLENGFIDLWVPRDETYKIKVEYDGKMVESEFSTFKNDGTCITTLQLL